MTCTEDLDYSLSIPLLCIDQCPQARDAGLDLDIQQLRIARDQQSLTIGNLQRVFIDFLIGLFLLCHQPSRRSGEESSRILRLVSVTAYLPCTPIQTSIRK